MSRAKGLPLDIQINQAQALNVSFQMKMGLFITKMTGEISRSQSDIEKLNWFER